jgi:acyl-coenzyme A synthetase/AMP-(fatty) acid ligase
MPNDSLEVPEAPPYFNFATDVLDHWATARPDSLALWCLRSNRAVEQKFSFQQVSELSTRAAVFFAGCGLRSGDRVLLMLPRVPQWWIAMLGLIRLGAVPVPATPLLTQRDVAYRLETARARATLTNEEGVCKVDGFDGIRFFTSTALAGAKSAAPIGWTDFDEGIRKASATFRAARTRSEDPGALFFTSATTGDPKMVLHTQASYGLGHRVTGKHWLDLKPGDIHWNLSDVGWAKAAWSSFYGPWQMGACVFTLDTPGKFDPALTLEILATYPITHWCAPPTALRLLVRQDLARWCFPHLRHCVTAGEPLNPEVLHRWRAATGLTLHEGYGQTETAVLIANCRSRGDEVQPGSMGKVAPGVSIAIIDETLREVPPGTEGEVAVRVHPQRPLCLFREYWLNPAEVERKFKGPWYLTGDRATRDERGYFWFVGRKDDVIKSAGYRIGPFEVESALLEHPAVLDVAVIGKPDPLRGHIVKACVVLRAGISPNGTLKSELQDHCKRLIAAYKYPREIEFVPELPKTTSGKTRHMELRQAQAAAP